jgi:hypothetical protein
MQRVAVVYTIILEIKRGRYKEITRKKSKRARRLRLLLEVETQALDGEGHVRVLRLLLARRLGVRRLLLPPLPLRSGTTKLKLKKQIEETNRVFTSS